MSYDFMQSGSSAGIVDAAGRHQAVAGLLLKSADWTLRTDPDTCYHKRHMPRLWSWRKMVHQRLNFMGTLHPLPEGVLDLAYIRFGRETAYTTSLEALTDEAICELAPEGDVTASLLLRTTPAPCEALAS